MHLEIFSSLWANIFVCMELGDAEMAACSQNLERQMVIFKILLHNELEGAAGLIFPVSGVDCSYCLRLNTM